MRWATYSEGAFKEGVSLTCDDELNRWQKYAYGEFFSLDRHSHRLRFVDMLTGCNELIFNPFVQWWRLGPINKQLRTFIWSEAPVHYKIGMLACKLFAFFNSGLALTRE
jgi:hypothetical protein